MIGALALALLATQDAAAGELRVLVLPAEVRFGEPFEVVVERSWSAVAPPPAWRDELLAPLRVRTMAHESRIARAEDAEDADGARVIERRTLRAWAFVIGDYTWAGTALRVVGSLDPAAPGALWDPFTVGVLTSPAPRWLQAVAGAALVASLSVLVRVLRGGRRRAVVAVAAPTVPLRAWAAAPSEPPAQLREALDAALAAIGMDARTRTAEELLADARLVEALGTAGCAAVATLRKTLDAASYAAGPPVASGVLAAAARTVADAVDAWVASRAADAPPREAAA